MVNLDLVPYIPLNIDYPKQEMLKEITSLEHFSYREWSSITLYGLAPDKNLSYRHYKVDPETTERNWFFHQQCPTTINWLQTQKYFIPDRIRAWRVEPGQRAPVHVDANTSHDKNLILPLNHPDGFWSNIDRYPVPFDQGAVVYNNALPHEFGNDSTETRHTLIIRVKEWLSSSSSMSIPVDRTSVKEISWETFIMFLYRSNHVTFEHMRSTKEYCGYLSNLKSIVDNPKYKFYGLFDTNDLVGVTSLCEFWDGHVIPKDTLRYRFIFLNPEYRKNGLAGKLLHYVKNLPEWRDYKRLFGYAKESHVAWCKSQGFDVLKEDIENKHTFMVKTFDDT